MKAGLRVYANGSWQTQLSTDVQRHKDERPGTALVVNGIVVYPGIGVTQILIDRAIEQSGLFRREEK